MASANVLVWSAIRKLHNSDALLYVWRFKRDIKSHFAGQRVSDRILSTWDKTAYYGSRFEYDSRSYQNERSFQNEAIVKVGGVEYRAERVSAAEYCRDHSITSLKFPEYGIPKKLWRGIYKTKYAGFSLLPEFEHHDFMSTSQSEETARMFLGAGRAQGILFEFERDETAICADVSWISKFGNEQEILFAPTKWRKRPEGIVHAEDGQTYNCILARYQLSGTPQKVIQEPRP